MLLIIKNKLTLLVFLIALFFTGIALSEELNFIKINPFFDTKNNQKMSSILALNFIIEDGFIYKDSFKIDVDKKTKFKIDKIEYPPNQRIFDKFRGKKSDVYDGNIFFRIHFKSPVKEDEKPDLLRSITVTYEACSLTTSFKPRTVNVGDLYFSGISPVKSSLDNTESDLYKKLRKGFIIAVIAAFVMGFVSSLTPCVYPIIPIVVSVIGSQSSGNKFKGFKLSVIFSLGLSLLYSILGISAAKTGDVFGSVFQSNYIIIVVSVVFGLLGLSLLGLYEIKIPEFISKRLSGKDSSKKGYAGTFLAGAVTGIVAVPCIGPFVISVITFSASQANILKGFFIMFSFSMGLSLLFLLIGTFSSLLTSIPKPGLWMIIIKKVFGLLLFAVFLYYLHKALTYSTFIIIFALSLFFLAWTFTKLDDFSSEKIKILHKRLSQFFAVGGAVLLLGLAFSSNLPVGNGLKGSKNGLPWITSEDEAIKLSKETQKPVLIDFYADWCPSCNELAKKTFPDKRITEKKDDFIFLRVDMTRRTLEGDTLSKKYGVYGLPTIIFLDADGKAIKKYTIEGFITPAVLSEIMTKVLKQGDL